MFWFYKKFDFLKKEKMLGRKFVKIKKNEELVDLELSNSL